MPTYKMIVLDLDHTLLNEQGKISQMNHYCLSRCLKRGIHVTFATGRTFESALPYAREVGIKLPLINCQGATITQMDGHIIFQNPLTNQLAKNILSVLLPLSLNVICCHESNVYARHFWSTLDNGQIIASQAAHHIPMPEDIGDILPLKIGASGSAEAIDDAYQQLRHRFGNQAHITKSSPYFLEVTHKRATKSAALAYLAAQLQINAKQIIAFGDSLNDLDMITYAGLGVAMDNGIDELKHIANDVTDTNDNDGVALFLNQLFFSEETTHA